MKKILNIIKKYYPYLILFLFFLFKTLFEVLYEDEIWNYGFAYNIFKGLIPYRDFNMVIPPLYPFIMSIFFFLFSPNLLTMYIINALMITHMCYLIKKLVKSNAIVVIFLLSYLFPLFPSYNLFLLYLFVLLLYFEKEKFNDYLIGLLIGFIILTKHTVGAFFLIASILVASKHKKKLVKRLEACFLVLLIFFIYLICSRSLYNFLDLCLFGLFDFSKNNARIFNFLFYFSIALLIILLRLIKKHPGDYNYLYLLAFMSNIIPLFDMYHISLLLIGIFIVLFIKKDIDFKINTKLVGIFCMIALNFLSIKSRIFSNFEYPNRIRNFEYRYLSPKMIDNIEAINKKKNQYKDKKVIFISSEGYLYKLINDEKITKLDLLNMGNYGYNGSEKLLNDIKKLNNSIFFVDKSELGEGHQTDQQLLKYILKNGRKIDKVAYYDIYTLGG